MSSWEVAILIFVFSELPSKGFANSEHALTFPLIKNPESARLSGGWHQHEMLEWPDSERTFCGTHDVTDLSELFLSIAVSVGLVPERCTPPLTTGCDEELMIWWGLPVGRGFPPCLSASLGLSDKRRLTTGLMLYWMALCCSKACGP